MNYSVRESEEDGFQTIELTDSAREMKAVVAPQLGNKTIALLLKGSNFLWRPERTLSDLLASRSLFGIPFLAPWANRLSKKEYWINNRCYQLNAALGNLRFDHHGQAIHGLLLFEPWKVRDLTASDSGAEVVSTLNFSAHPALMSQFPFAHTLEMRHLLKDGRLRITVRITSECAEPFPVSIGFHPYYTIPNSHRNDWQLEMSGRTHFELNSNQVPTGATTPVEQERVAVKAVELDDVYSDLARNEEGEAHFAIRSAHGSVSTSFGPGYKVAVLYAPQTGDFVCVEPMAAVTDAINLHQTDTNISLPMVEPGASWEEWFWAEPSFSTAAS